MSADEADDRVRTILFYRFSDLAIVFERGRRCVNDDVIVILRFLQALLDLDVMRRAIHQPGARHERRWLGKPRGIPIAGDLTPRLVARTGAAIKTIEARRTQK